jgi:hypothetical protein
MRPGVAGSPRFSAEDVPHEKFTTFQPIMSRNNSKQLRKSSNGIRAKAIRRSVRQMLISTAETKNWVFTQAATSTAIAGQIQSVSQGIVEGDSFNNRSGRQITTLNVNLIYKFNLPVAAQISAVRIMLFSDRMSHQSAPVVLEVLNSAAVTSPLSPSAYIEKRFKIHYDKVHALVFSGADQQVIVDVRKTIREKISYLGPTDIATSLGKNQMFVLVITDTAANAAVYSYDLAIRYLDM